MQGFVVLSAVLLFPQGGKGERGEHGRPGERVSASVLVFPLPYSDTGLCGNECVSVVNSIDATLLHNTRRGSNSHIATLIRDDIREKTHS